MTARRLSLMLAAIALALAALSVVRLEQARGTASIEQMRLGATPVTLYRPDGSPRTLVILSHGFGGSRQMMEAIALTLARAGHLVVSFDYYGHGRNGTPLSPDIERLTGTTEDLVKQTLDVLDRARTLTGQSRVAFVGHSMATDVIVRAAARTEDVAAVAAISMYSDAVTARHPDRLLIVSGAFEGRLRDVALGAVAQIGPATEGETATANGLSRRAVAAPRVGHVGVLWSPATLREVTDWLGGAAPPARTGPWIGLLLLSLLLLFRPITTLLPSRPAAPAPSLAGSAGAAGIGAAAAAALTALPLSALPLSGFAGFGALALALGLWGAVVLALLRAPLGLSARTPGPDLGAALLIGLWGLGVFALALDRYGAAFVPVGPRLPLALLLLPAAILFAVADRAVVQGRGLAARILQRLPILAALFAGMIVSPTRLGLVFTVLPVLVLFWLVYGTMAHWVARRTGPTGAGIGAGLCLAWAIAASTPLFEG